MKLSSTLLALRTRRVCPAAVAMFVACMSGAAGEEVFSFDQTPGRLPKTAIPLHYAIELEPDLENLTLAGSEVIDLDLREATTRLVLNATDITLAAASIDGASANAAIALDPAAIVAELRVDHRSDRLRPPHGTSHQAPGGRQEKSRRLPREFRSAPHSHHR